MEKKPKTDRFSDSDIRKVRSIRDEIRVFRPKDNGRKEFTNFYTELDRKKKSKIPFVVSMLFIFLLIFVAIVYGFWSLRVSLLGGSIFSEKNDNAYLTAEVSNALNGKSSGDAVTIKISEKELIEFIGVGSENFPLKKSSLKIKSEAINISGRVGESFFSLPISIKCLAKAENGKLKIEPDKTGSGMAMMPSSIKNPLNEYFDETVGTYTSDIGRINVQEVVLKDGELILIGTAL